MPWLDFEGLNAQAERFDALAAQMPQADGFCASTAWVSPAQAAFAPGARPRIWAGASGYLALMELQLSDGSSVTLPLEAGWGLATPLVGLDPDALVDELGALVDEGVFTGRGVYLSGLTRNGAWMRAVLRRFGQTHRLGMGDTCPRRTAALRGGLDGFMGRRSARFRANVRRAVRGASREGVEVEYRAEFTPAEARGCFERIVNLEARSWKGLDDAGMDKGPPLEFYRLMVARLAASGGLRVLFLKRGGQDLAFCFGGVLGETFRGLQVSFDAEHRRLGLGNVAQYEMVRRLCGEGLRYYDLGTDMPYKARWAELGLETLTLVVLLE